MQEFKPRAIAPITVEDYVQVPYFEFKVDKEGKYRCPKDVYLKPDCSEVYYLLSQKDVVLTWSEVTVLVDVSLTGRLYKKGV